MLPLHADEGVGVSHFTVEELAVRWKCKPQTIRQNRRQWGLKPFRFGKRLLFTAANVEAVECQRAENPE